MKNKFLSKTLLVLIALAMIMPLPLMRVAAEEDVLTVDDPLLDVSTEVTAADLGATEAQINNATVEPSTTETVTGTLIEIGNTTAKKTSIIIRMKNKLNQMVDQTIEVDSSTLVQNDANSTSNLSNWIAGDQVTYTTTNYEGGSMRAQKIKNRAIKWYHDGRNGWITAIRPEENEVDIQWAGSTYTLNTADAKLVAGIKNPATLSDFNIGDRVRARVSDDGDGNPLTWKTSIMVVLRRGNALFMRVTRWVVPGKIISIPEDLTMPVTMEVKVLPSDFFQTGDVNNLIGEPGKIIKVDITDSTKLFRRFFGKAYLKEFSEDDEISIIGRRDEATGHLVAKFIVNKSIQKLGKVMRLGKVDAVDTTNNTIDVTLVRTRRALRNWTIQVTAITKIIKNGELITLADIEQSDKIRIVGGSANFNTNTVLAPLKVILVKEALPSEETATSTPTL